MKALVTGASSGIGKALVEFLASQGFELILVSRHQETLEQIAQTLPSKTQVVPADLATEKGRDLIRETLLTEKPELVVNNAGFGVYGDVLDTDFHLLQNLLHVNVTAVYELTIEAAKMMKDNQIQGTIINVASVAGWIIFPCFAAYAAAKRFVIHFSQSLDAEVKAHGIRVLVSCPGPVDTQFRRVASQGVIKSDRPVSMPVDYAVKRIWSQYQGKKAVDTFDWKYRVLGFLAEHLIPKRLQATLARKSVKSLYE